MITTTIRLLRENNELYALIQRYGEQTRYGLVARKSVIEKGTNCHKAGLIVGRFGKSSTAKLRKMVEIARLVVFYAYGKGVTWQPCESKIWNSKTIELRKESMTPKRGERASGRRHQSPL